MVVLVTVTVSAFSSSRELDGVSANTKIDGVTGHSCTRHHDAVVAASSPNHVVKNGTSEEQGVCTGSTDDIVIRGKIEDNIICSVKADVVSTCITLDGGC